VEGLPSTPHLVKRSILELQLANRLRTGRLVVLEVTGTLPVMPPLAMLNSPLSRTKAAVSPTPRRNIDLLFIGLVR
jgi:hypothetical protein